MSRCVAGILGDNVKITKDKTKVTVVTETQFSKRCHMSMPCNAMNCLLVLVIVAQRCLHCCCEMSDLQAVLRTQLGALPAGISSTSRRST